MPNPESIAVIGAGADGRGIAQLAALAGFRVVLEDLIPGSLRRAEGEIRDSLREAATKGELTERDAQAALARIEYGTSLESAARDAEIVIEAVPEEFDSKEEIFRLLDRFCRPEAFLVTISTESSVTEIAQVTLRSDRLVGMRFTVPTHKSTSIEVVRGTESSDEAVETVMNVARALVADVSLIDERTAHTARTS
ncbi:MAG TPA: 3-hydroxyacyl-CoA dehydrogenase NAD-binding domain-containing protein [candidate division Zixibacteria bacterium]|nr:3-hydroxyacyl-CoA dehydrogenase NAD-binding domain-containing protein [candidate division Zixibacteria bacterium]